MSISNYPLITVIMPSYNSNQYIYEAIDSVMEQTYPYIEFIITDDCSSEFPKNEIIDYINSHNRGNIDFNLILNPKNLGTVKNLNGALKSSHGEYIFGLAADDAYDNPHVLTNWIEEFKLENASAMTSCMKVCGYTLDDVKYIYPSEIQKELIKTSSPSEVWKLHIRAPFCHCDSVMAWGSALAFRRDVLQQYNLHDEKYQLMEDHPTIEKLLANNVEFKLYDAVTIKYRDGGVSHQTRPNIFLLKDFDKYRSTVIKRAIKEKRLPKKVILVYVLESYLSRINTVLTELMYNNQHVLTIISSHSRILKPLRIFKKHLRRTNEGE